MSTAEILMFGMQFFLAFCQILIMLYAFRSFLRKPHDSIEARVLALEVKMKDMESSLHQGNDRFRNQESTNEVLIKSILALVEFEIQYCIEEKKPMSDGLKEAKKNLHAYLAKGKEVIL